MTQHEQLLEAANAAASAAVIAITNKVTASGVAMTIGSWFLSSEFGILMGILIGLAGVVINWRYRYLDNKRAQQQHERWMGDQQNTRGEQQNARELQQNAREQSYAQAPRQSRGDSNGRRSDD